jgi:CheY-like chemotaxis protein
MKESQLIYYLDDDRDDLYYFKNIAGSLGHKATLFTDGHEMLQTLRTSIKRPDIIFLDVHMPILNGQEMLEIIKQSPDLKHIPVVMISGAYPKKLARHFLESGANYLMKKTHGKNLKAILEQVFDEIEDYTGAILTAS